MLIADVSGLEKRLSHERGGHYSQQTYNQQSSVIRQNEALDTHHGFRLVADRVFLLKLELAVACNGWKTVHIIMKNELCGDMAMMATDSPHENGL